MSQADLARAVTERGVKFYPQTVQKIENGTRSIGVEEALAITDSLEARMEELFVNPDWEVVEDSVAAFEDASGKVEIAIKQLLVSQMELALKVDVIGAPIHDNEIREALETDVVSMLLRDIASGLDGPGFETLPASNRLWMSAIFRGVLADEDAARARIESGNLPEVQALRSRRRESWEEQIGDLDAEA